MTLRLTPEILEASYNLLAVTPPFNRWKLPVSDDVEFRVTRDPNREGDYVDAGHAHSIGISEKFHDKLSDVLETMAHEIAHLRQQQKAPRERHHGSYFKALARRICKVHGWSEKTF